MRSLKLSNRFFIASLFLSTSVFSAVQVIQPSENSYQDIQEALILAEPGDVVRLTAGTFYLKDSLSLDVSGVQVEGEGMNQTILDFSDQQSGAQGLSVTSDKVTLQDFSIQNAKGDAIKVKGVTNIKFLRVKTLFHLPFLSSGLFSNNFAWSKSKSLANAKTLSPIIPIFFLISHFSIV